MEGSGVGEGVEEREDGGGVAETVGGDRGGVADLDGHVGA